MKITCYSFRYMYKWQTAVKMEAAGPSKMLVPVYQKTSCHIQVDAEV